MGQELPLQWEKIHSNQWKRISSSVPQDSILGPLLFAVYVNYLKKDASNILGQMFADDIKLFFTHQDIRYLFHGVNQELENINQ